MEKNSNKEKGGTIGTMVLDSSVDSVASMQEVLHKGGA